MKNIPIIGGAGRIFEIFVPGAFLLVNLAGVIYFLPLQNNQPRTDVVSVMSDPVLSLTIFISFGYLLGVILRMMRSASADNWSAKFLRLVDSNARQEKYYRNLYAYEKFPYIGWLGVVCEKNFPEDAFEFYEQIWCKGSSRAFFNFCKLMIISQDEHAATELYSAESLSRYISSMFYALFLALILVSSIVVLNLIEGVFLAHIALLLFTYFVAILVILRNYRFIRIKEVEALFAASYKNRSLFSSNGIT
jgi:hypothetical protein